MQIISNDQTVKNDTIQGLKDFNSQSLATQVKKGEELVSMMPAIKKVSDLMGDDIVDLSTKNKTSKNQTGDYDRKWSEKAKPRPLQEIND